MGVKTTAKVWEWSRAEGTERLVMLALADFCDDQDECFPGVRRIAAKCLISERTAQRAFRALEVLGELKVLEKLGVRTNGGATNRFRLILSARKGGDIQGSEGVRGGDIQGIKVVTNRAQGGDNGVTLIIREPSENHQGEFALSGEAEEFRETWNKLPPDFPRIREISSGRARVLHARLKEPAWRSGWREALARMPASDFLSGRVAPRPGNGPRKPFVASPEFFLRPDTVTKILEGKYDNAEPDKAPDEFWRKHL